MSQKSVVAEPASMRSLVLLILGISVASAGGYYYRDDIPTPYRFWESERIVKLQHHILDRLKLPSVEVAALETATSTPPAAMELEPASADEAPISAPVVAADSMPLPAREKELELTADITTDSEPAPAPDAMPPSEVAELTLVDEAPVSTPAVISDSITPSEVAELTLVDEAPVSAPAVISDSITPPELAELAMADETPVSVPASVTDFKTPKTEVLELAQVDDTAVSTPTPEPALALVADVEDNMEVDESLVAELVEQVEKDARVYVKDLSEPQKNNVEIKKADHFVSGNQILELLADDTFVEIVAPLSSKPIIQALAPRSRSEKSKLGADFDTKAPKELVLIQATSTENLQALISEESEAQNTFDPVMIVRQANAIMPVLPELARTKQVEATQTKDDKLLQQSESPQITIAELMKDEPPVKEDSVYYVRTVKKDDQQGIWGIIVDGLTENFANGIAISRDEKVETYQVNIPRLSDDALPDNSSSFLGKLVDRKTRECFVYNFVEKKIGQNPDLIYPGQELLIINFEAEELIDIYTYFVENG